MHPSAVYCTPGGCVCFLWYWWLRCRRPPSPCELCYYAVCFPANLYYATQPGLWRRKNMQLCRLFAHTYTNQILTKLLPDVDCRLTLYWTNFRKKCGSCVMCLVACLTVHLTKRTKTMYEKVQLESKDWIDSIGAFTYLVAALFYWLFELNTLLGTSKKLFYSRSGL